MRKILTVVIILAVIWAIPAARGRITAAALPVLEKLGPVGEAIITPARRMAAKNQARQILGVIASDSNEGREVPDERGFPAWLTRRSGHVPPTDPWGRTWWLGRGRGTLTVGSSGADGEKNTADDVKHTIQF